MFLAPEPDGSDLVLIFVVGGFLVSFLIFNSETYFVFRFLNFLFVGWCCVGGVEFFFLHLGFSWVSLELQIPFFFVGEEW